MSMTNKIAGIALALCISLPASAQTTPQCQDRYHCNDDPIKWAWTCKSSGFYTIEAFPNGSYKPSVDSTGNPQVVINIRKASKDLAQVCGSPDTPKYFYYAEMQGQYLATIYGTNTPTFCENQAMPSFDHSTLDAARGSVGLMSFEVSRDDNDWRFIISGTDLTTQRSARKLRILSPGPAINFDAKAGVWMITGQCIMTANQDK
jgi:hypothetical protein